MIYKEGDKVTYREGGKGEPAEGRITGKVQAFPVIYIVEIPLGPKNYRYVMADEKELKIRRES